jgi:hypothetical protein
VPTPSIHLAPVAPADEVAAGMATVRAEQGARRCAPGDVVEVVVRGADLAASRVDIEVV